MVESVQSGYKELTEPVVFSGTQVLDLAGIDEWVSLSDEIDNSVVKYLYADFEVLLGSAVFTGDAASQLKVYLLPSLDGTNYPDWDDDDTAEAYGNDPYLIGSPVTNSSTVAQRMLFRKVNMPPGKFKIGARNKTGVALAATGNTINFRRWGFAST